MAKFKIEWDNGRVEEVNQADCATVAQFISCRFGSQGCGKHKVSLANEVKAMPVVKATDV